MKDIATECETFSTPVLFEPTSIPKSLKIFDYPETVQQQRIQYVTPNQFELEAMYDCIQAHPILSRKSIRVQQQPRLKGPKLAESILPYALFLSNYVPNVITKLGEEGCLFVNDSTIEYFSPEMIDPTDIKSVTGAGDCFVGTFIANLHYSRQLNLHRMKQIISKSQLSSIRTLKSDGAVSPSIAEDLLVR
ncbi:hypothetical protein BDB01DRAFT_568025 [Pilobolus umbonatus]|nr:hypothetical protein BDB01DRAFT_568025 [Pilobolus umbonatus]